MASFKSFGPLGRLRYPLQGPDTPTIINNEVNSRRNERIPPRLSARRRELSFSKTHQPAQQYCTFLAKLPLELRFKIYKYVLGYSIIHIFALRRRMGHAKCSANKESDIERACLPQDHEYTCRHPIWGDDEPWNPPTLSQADLALLRTCRQIYAESIDIPYSSNMFDFATAESFNSFARTILPRRLAVITSLAIGFFDIFEWPRRILRGPLETSHPHHPIDLEQDWDPMWNTIKTQMPGLRELRVVLFGPQLWNPSVQEMLVKPMQGLEGLEAFQLEVRKASGQAWDPFEYFVVESLPSTRAIIEHACKA